MPDIKKTKPQPGEHDRIGLRDNLMDLRTLAINLVAHCNAALEDDTLTHSDRFFEVVNARDAIAEFDEAASYIDCSLWLDDDREECAPLH